MRSVVQKGKRFTVEVLSIFLLTMPGCITSTVIRTPTRDVLVEEIHKFKGTPYKYGGSTPGGTDCSGFTMTVFARFGVKLPHTASGQFKMGKSVTRENLKIGDLVFFRTQGSKEVNHVGIYLWDGKMVHASSTDGVIVVPFTGNIYYEHRYAGARRIIDF
jgi:cell wall-associated NlpC family hydrolase